MINCNSQPFVEFFLEILLKVDLSLELADSCVHFPLFRLRFVEGQKCMGIVCPLSLQGFTVGKILTVKGELQSTSIHDKEVLQWCYHNHTGFISHFF